RGVSAILKEDFAKKLTRGKDRIVDQRQFVDLGIQRFDHFPNKRGLTATVLARQKSTTFVVAECIQDSAQRFRMHFRRVKESWVRSIFERLLLKPPVLQIQNYPPTDETILGTSFLPH